MSLLDFPSVDPIYQNDPRALTLLAAALEDPDAHWYAKRILPALTAAATPEELALVAAWNPLLHPRGPDGKFIRKFGWVKWLEGAQWKTGYVTGHRRQDRQHHGEAVARQEEDDRVDPVECAEVAVLAPEAEGQAEPADAEGAEEGQRAGRIQEDRRTRADRTWAVCSGRGADEGPRPRHRPLPLYARRSTGWTFRGNASSLGRSSATVEAGLQRTVSRIVVSAPRIDDPELYDVYVNDGANWFQVPSDDLPFRGPDGEINTEFRSVTADDIFGAPGPATAQAS